MILTDKIASRTTELIGNTLNSSSDDLEKIEYGIKVILANVFKLVLLFLTAYCLNVFQYTLIAFISFAILRTFASGTHAKGSLLCILMNYLTFIGNVYLSIYFSLSTSVLTAIFFISFLLTIIYAPADTASRPLVSKKLRHMLKTLSIITVCLSFIFCLYLDNLIVRSIIAYSILQESLCITPIAYKILGNSYRNYVNITL